MELLFCPCCWGYSVKVRDYKTVHEGIHLHAAYKEPCLELLVVYLDVCSEILLVVFQQVFTLEKAKMNFYILIDRQIC